MDRHLEKIVRILTEESGVFQEILSLEENKTGTIINQDAKLLEKISREQEGFLTILASLEKDRMNRIAEFMKSKNRGKDAISLNDIASLAGPEGGRIRSLGDNLRRLLARLDSLQETNRTLINDNMEYYNILLSGLKRGRVNGTGYSSDGKEEEKVTQALLFNKTA